MESKYPCEFSDSLYKAAVRLHKSGLISDTEIQEYDHDGPVREDKVAFAIASSMKREHTFYWGIL
jgi:hypothetical protein